MFRKGVVSLLTHTEGFDVIAEAVDGEDLIRKIQALPEPPDVCLLDINMPKMNGTDTLIALKAMYPKMRFLILTMLDHEYVILKMLRHGANGYLLKEDDPEELINAIRFVHNNQFYHSDLVSGRLISIVQRGIDYSEIQLSDKEQRFLELCCTEATYKDIAEAMKLSVRTVEGYRDTLFKKLDVSTRTGLVIYAMKLGIGQVV
jgi:DNA-binding NarL/FixJ family response regulator